MIVLGTSYVEYDNTTVSGSDSSMKQKGDVQDIIVINGRAATTVRGAQKILTERAKALGSDREYSRDTVYRLLVDQKIEAIPTPSANYYFVEDLESVPITPKVGRRGKGKASVYTAEKKGEALHLREQGLTHRQIAQQIGVPFQTVGNWIRQSQKRKAAHEK
jgi:hypothetical protein